MHEPPAPRMKPYLLLPTRHEATILPSPYHHTPRKSPQPCAHRSGRLTSRIASDGRPLGPPTQSLGTTPSADPASQRQPARQRAPDRTGAGPLHGERQLDLSSLTAGGECQPGTCSTTSNTQAVPGRSRGNRGLPACETSPAPRQPRRQAPARVPHLQAIS